jgi:prepilin-type N-terminal cleavage/methylation domain-containing protein
MRVSSLSIVPSVGSGPMFISKEPCEERRPNNHAGFTLLELLVAITVIAILMGLSFSVFRGLTDQAKEEATNATIQKVNRLFEDRKVKFDRLMSLSGSQRQRQAINRVTAILRAANYQGQITEKQIQILAKKMAFMFDFPQRMIHRTTLHNNNDVVTAIPALAALPNERKLPKSLYDKILVPAANQELVSEGNTSPTEAEVQARVEAKWIGGTDAGKTFPGHQLETESSELLYFFLTVSDDFGAPVLDSDRFNSTEVQDTDNDGLPEFVDAWGTPLRYYPYPTLLINPLFRGVPFHPRLEPPSDLTDTRTVTELERKVASILIKGLPPAPYTLGNGAQPRDMLLTDPDDPIGELYTAMEASHDVDNFNNIGVPPGNAVPDLCDFYNETTFHTPDTYHIPLIVSAGPDRVLGLFEPHQNGPNEGGSLAGYPLPVSPVPSDFEAVLNGPISDSLTNRNRRVGGRR